MGKADLPVLAFDSAKAFERWMRSNHASEGLWLKLARKDSGEASVTYAEAVEIALGR